MLTMDQEREIGQVLADYFPDTAYQIRAAGEEGQNNTTAFVDTEHGCYVVRIYQNENPLSVLQFEHELLERLAEQNLSFQTPRLIPTREGRTYTETPSGKYAALFAHIPGRHPSKNDLVHVRAIGAAIAELSTALQGLELPRASPSSGYYEIYKIHPLVTRDALALFFQDPVIGFDPEEAAWAQEALASCEREIARLAEHDVQLGLIHGDVTVGNTLLLGERISGILDFEFAAEDYRAMEMAVFFVGLLGDDEVAWGRMEAFLAGYGSQATWSRAEVEALPLFLKLRKLTNFLHLIGRHLAGHNPLEDAYRKLAESRQTVEWLTRNRERLQALCESYLLP